MFRPDKTHEQLMVAESALVESQSALAKEVKWAASMLQMLLSAIETGNTQVVVDLVKKDAERVNRLQEYLVKIERANTLAFSALVMAREHIPNTTPPHPGGLESFGG